jgi:hypothetical protein
MAMTTAASSRLRYSDGPDKRFVPKEVGHGPAHPHTHRDKRAGRRISLSGVILGLDPRISISVHSAELSGIPGATDARARPAHDAEGAISIAYEGLS